MSKKEEKAREYALNMYRTYLGYDKFDIQDSYEAGWDEALKSQWINVKDKLPATEEVVLVLTSNGKVSTTKRYQPKDCRGKNIGLVTWKGSTTFVNSIIAWITIPPFDNVLKDK